MENEEKNLEEKLQEQDEFAFLDDESEKELPALEEEVSNISLENESSEVEEEIEEIQEANEIEIQEEQNQELITVRPVKFQQFEQTPTNRTIKKNLDIMQDVSMHVSVELGRTKSTIKEVMGLVEGSVVELDKIAGEQVEVFVNEKLVAKGEVIVIEDKFGVRITSTNIQKTI